jgi:hypothetical protein
MRASKGLLALLLVIAFAPAPTALGQSAGDEQYVDPFQNQPEDPGGGTNSGNPQGGSQQGSSGGGDGSGSGTQGGQGTSAPTTGADDASGSSADTGGSIGGSATTADSGTLPQTGLPLAGPAALGVLLLVCGVALRRRA